jgi:undecaprenyl-diphosphatase
MTQLDTWQAAVLGLIQGLTEFLPVSSSGHLRVGEHFFGLTEPQSFFDVGLHVGTLLVVMAYFWRDLLDFATAPLRVVGHLGQRHGWSEILQDPGLRGLGFVLLGTIPTGIIGLTLGPRLESAAMSLDFVAGMFLVNTVILFSTQYLALPLSGARLNTGFRGMRWWDAVVIGIVQGFSVTRGISRSGSTISAALIGGVDRETAGRFSFLLSMPAIAGATLLTARDTAIPVDYDWTPFAVGVGCAVVSGAVALKLLMTVVKRGQLHRFGWYTLFLGLLLLAGNHFGSELAVYWEAAFHGAK